MVATLSLALQAVSVVAVAAVVAALARRPSVRHALWTGGVVGSLLLPVAALVLPTIHVAEPAFVRTTIESVAPQLVASPAPVSRPATDPLKGLRLGEQAPATVNWAVILNLTWALGAVASLLLLIRRSLRVRGLLREARPITSPVVLDEWASLHDRYSITPDRATIHGTPEMIAPATCGLLRARVLLPINNDDWSRERVRAVLAHELAHVARRDCLTQSIAQVASAVYWFSPLHRYVERMMSVERERACDEFVLRTGLSARSYARALVDAERDALNFRAPDSLVLAMAPASRSELEHRVEHILDGSTPERAMGMAARAAIVSFVMAIVVVTSTVRLDAALPQDAPEAVSRQEREPDQRGDSISQPASERVPGDVIPTDAVVRALLAGPDSTFAMHLLHAIERIPQGEEDLVRERARWALAQSVDGALVEPLIARLNDGDWRVRAYAAWALGIAQDPRATPAVIAQLGHPTWRLRAMAASALQSIGDVRARDAMLRAVGDDAWQVRSAAVSYLGALSEPGLESVIRARLSDRHIAVRMAAQQALRR